jgi:hypothetical protein
MSGVFRNIDPPPPHRPASVYLPPLVSGEDTLAGCRGGGGPIVQKTPDTALDSIHIFKYFVLFIFPSLISTDGKASLGCRAKN